MDKKITVVGLGFVGLPLSLSFAMRGYPVIGLDANTSLVEDLNNGVTFHLEEYNGKPIQEILKTSLAEETFKATANYNIVYDKTDSYIVTVGLPVKDGMPMYDHFESAMIDLGQGLKQGDLVLIRSTLVPGATEEVAKPILEHQSGLKAGKDFYLAYASERIAEGKAFAEFENMPTVVAGINEASAIKAKELLSKITKAEIHIATDMKVVEAAKVFENVSRDVNIAMANQFATFCQAMGIDTMETFQMANTHKRVNLLVPGPGVGGYCLPNAFYYLRPKMAELDVDLSLLQMSRMINDQIPARIVGILETMLEKKGKTLRDAKVGVLGLAMKDYSNDDRISPAHDVCRLLDENQVKLKAFDPAVHGSYSYSVDTLDEAIQDVDAVIILAKQKAFDGIYLEALKEKMKAQPILIDTKHVFTKEQAIKHGFDYFSI